MPYVLAAGPIVTGMVDDPDPRLVRVATRADAEHAVDSLIRHGVDFIKVHDRLSRDAYAGIMARASARGIPVAGHLPVALDAAEVSTAGQRSIEHLGNASWGTVAVSKRADLVLLDANPLSDIRNTTKIYAILVNGRFIGPDQRKQLLAHVQATAYRLPANL
jgi:imidazolonepropionase-like amidohydrolase